MRRVIFALVVLATPVAAQQVDSLEGRRINAARLWASGDRAAARREYEALAQIVVARGDLLTSKQMAGGCIGWSTIRPPSWRGRSKPLRPDVVAFSYTLQALYACSSAATGSPSGAISCPT